MEKATLSQGQELLKLVAQSGIKRGDFQQLLESGEFTALLKQFDSTIVVRKVTIDYTRTPNEVIRKTRHIKDTDASVVKSMPARGSGIQENVEVVFFKMEKSVSDKDLAVEFEKRGLIPDPYAVAAVNEADHSFSDGNPNATHWKDSDGEWCFISFRKDNYGRIVHVKYRHTAKMPAYEWKSYWWFGGVRK